MLRIISWVILKILGWKVVGQFPPEIKKCVVVVAPHTSMWDFVYGLMIFSVLRKKTSFLIKNKYFFWPLGPIISGLGAIPVENKPGLSQFHGIANHVRNADKLYLIITAEGTRKPVKRWKTGFYQLARESGVPIIMCWIDYVGKVGGISSTIVPSDEMEKDIQKIQRFYKAKWAKHPEKFYEIPPQAD
ncbi:MAG: 1-acyl-sn-glycerol-3-phosphate acyltransferase [Bacteroidales bacterium]|nr:1-acyl-sn-glycerol-3-phosphate acyltransferase [Bacteroidales bacterium]